MSSSNQQASSGGIGVLGLLGVLFIGLKLTGIIEWSWWLVLLPFYGGFAVLAIILLIVFFIMVIAEMNKSR